MQIFQPSWDSRILSRWNKSEKNHTDHGAFCSPKAGGPLYLPWWQSGLDNFIKPSVPLRPSLPFWSFSGAVTRWEIMISSNKARLQAVASKGFFFLALRPEENSVVHCEQKITQIQVPWSQLMISGWVILTPVGQHLFIPHRMYILSNACRVVQNQLMNYSEKIKLPFNI